MTKELLNQYFEYKDGMLFWKERLSFNVQVGRRAGSISQATGYRRIRIDDKYYYEHRVIWFMHNGVTDLDIDHIDRDKLNNRLENLRSATKSQNMVNSRIMKNNTTGFKGVVFDKTKGKFVARISMNLKRIHLGLFDTAELGSEAYKKAATELYGEFANY